MYYIWVNRALMLGVRRSCKFLVEEHLLLEEQRQGAYWPT